VASWTLGSVRGIPVRVHWSLLLVLPLFAYVMARQYFAGEDALTLRSIAWGSALAVTLFLSVLVHEFSHSFMALRLGSRVRSILLMPLGGVSQMESMPERPRDEFLVTVVGPLTNFLIAGPLLVLHFLQVVPDPGGLATYVRWAGWLNVGLGAFNLFLPAFPLDGGRLLRAALASRMGLRQATRTAAAIGRGLAFLLGVFGLLALNAGGIWLILIAFFIYLGAGAEESATTLRALLRGRTARDLMTAQPVALAPDDTLDDVQRTMLRTRHLSFPVLQDGKVVGCLGLEEMAAIDHDRLAATLVRDAMSPEIPRVAPDEAAEALVRRLQESGHGHAVVLDGDDVVGIVSRSDVQRLVQILDALGDGATRAS